MQRIYKSPFGGVILAVLYLAIGATGVLAIASLSKTEIENILIRYIPWNLRINFLLLIVALYFCRRDMARMIKSLFLRATESAEVEGN
ncbi:MAG: hypothetical protein PHY31_08365, partial [Smithellaceae bacterium]|nr:hypothetical protein [Smithellaceae bacterium]